MTALTYVALGDSISIDDYTKVKGGGAASQFARMIGAETFVNLTRDGLTTRGVVESLAAVDAAPSIVTLTAGGNDILELMGSARYQPERDQPRWLDEGVDETIERLRAIAGRIAAWRCTAIWNTIYDPTDGSDAVADRVDIPRYVRARFDRLNEAIRKIATQHGFLLADLEALFHGHGVESEEPWYVFTIEPNLAGATAIAERWHAIYRDAAW